MSLRIRWSLLPTVVASMALAAGNLALSLPAAAQSTPPPPPPGAAPATGGDPPARVGWLSNLSGSVSFHSASQDQWVTATQNYPVASGDAVWTQPQAAASVMVDSTRIALDGGTELTAQEIDQTTITASLSQGEVFLDIAALQQGQSVVIETPRGTAQITANGEYEIYAGDSSTPTYVTTVTGSIQFTGLGVNNPQTVGAQQTLVVQGTNPVQAQLEAMQQDQFLTSMLQQITPPPPPSATQAPPACAQMTGAATLSQYGSWQPQPSVGTVWFPQVAPSWVPYRDGQWAYVQPWGWTWVDRAPWGFAPFHYGRWAQFDGRWGWVPQPAGYPAYGPSYQPVYAPALVTFLGAAVGAFAGAAFASGAIGWAPLGIHDPYYPPYGVSPRYFGAYNRSYVPNYHQFYQHNVTIVNNRVSYRNVTINNYGNGGQPGEGFNRQGATFAPRDAMLGSRPINEVARPLPENVRAEPFRPGETGGAQGLPRPTAGTLGVTPAFAQREHLPEAPPGAAIRPVAQGPAIRAVPAGAEGRRAMPELVPHAAVAPSFRGGAARPAGAPVGAVPVAGGRPPAPGAENHPAAPGLAPQRGLPPLAAPAARGTEPRPEFKPAAPGAGGAIRPGGPVPAEQHGAPNAPRTEAAPGVTHGTGVRPAEAPRPEAPRPVEAPRTEAARPEAPRPEAPRPEAPRAEAPRPEAARPEAPRPAPHIEAPRAEAPRAEAPRAEAPRAEAPRAEAPRAQAPRGGQGHEVRPPRG
jgi:hypothetical protein